MPKIRVYHNPNFLYYRGSHSQIVPLTQPVATVTVPEGLSLTEMLEFGYTQTQHVHTSWFNNPQVMVHLRSTSMGDMIGDGEGNLYVVELLASSRISRKRFRRCISWQKRFVCWKWPALSGDRGRKSK